MCLQSALNHIPPMLKLVCLQFCNLLSCAHCLPPSYGCSNYMMPEDCDFCRLLEVEAELNGKACILDQLEILLASSREYMISLCEWACVSQFAYDACFPKNNFRLKDANLLWPYLKASPCFVGCFIEVIICIVQDMMRLLSSVHCCYLIKCYFTSI